MTQVEELVQFLRDRSAERATLSPSHGYEKERGWDALFEMYDRAVKASQAPDALTRLGGGPVLTVLDEVFRSLALEHAGHEDYRLEWRPQGA
ncbi:hypothetical protein ADL07_19370 [Streptomyces sp. NRRL F-4707]|uniref:hypothetical protein n=1 Tax=Streptomyces TaxID=1883 RepID=UPI0006AE0561|nr:hypothetical protein [Streptomyces sp. NRRL F-4707]KOX30396.1 hypothetical protein ADL07_19370 [Streptomyces sp. NRRL F-4707]